MPNWKKELGGVCLDVGAVFEMAVKNDLATGEFC